MYTYTSYPRLVSTPHALCSQHFHPVHSLYVYTTVLHAHAHHSSPTLLFFTPPSNPALPSSQTYAYEAFLRYVERANRSRHVPAVGKTLEEIKGIDFLRRSLRHTYQTEVRKQRNVNTTEWWNN